MARYRRAVVIAGAVLVVTSLLVLVLQGDSIRDARWWSTAGFAAIPDTLKTRFGYASLLRALFTLGLLAPAVRAPKREATAPWTALVGAGLLIGTTLRGHATGGTKPVLDIAFDLLHLLGVSVWAAGLVSLLAVCRPAIRRAEPEDRPARWSAVVNRLSPMALVAVGTLLLGGTLSSFRRVATLNGLFHSSYGRVLVAKIAVFTVLLGLGAVNIFVIRPRITDDERWADRLKRSVSVEVCGMAVAFSLAGALTGMAPPASSALNALSQQGAAGPYTVAVSLVPVGTALDIHVVVADSNGLAARDVAETRLELTERTRRLGPLTPPLVSAGPGHGIAQGVSLARPGDWVATVILRRGEFDEFRTEFTFHL
jgi:copper transport protein